MSSLLNSMCRKPSGAELMDYANRLNDLSVILLLRSISRKVDYLMASLADIQAAVAAEATVEQSVILLLGQLSSQLQTAISGNDPTAMQAVVDDLNAHAAALAAAVAANTPPAPAPTPDPAPTP